jgi:hypothetical protein
LGIRKVSLSRDSTRSHGGQFAAWRRCESKKLGRGPGRCALRREAAPLSLRAIQPQVRENPADDLRILDAGDDLHRPAALLAYHVAVLKGTDVDQPRNLAKSLTVE